MSRVLALAAIGLGVLGSCKDRHTPAPEPRAAAAKPLKTRPSARTQLHAFRPLLAEAARAELRIGGLVIDFGTADEHKYTRGGWGTGWEPSSSGARVPHAVIGEKPAELAVVLLDAPAEIRVRARSKKPQELAIEVDGKELGHAEVDAEWSVVRVPVEGLDANQRVTFTLSHSADEPVDLDWLALPADPDVESPVTAPRTAPVSLAGGVRRALIAPSARTYSFYLQVPASGQLVFDTGSTADVEFAVRAETVDGELHELYREQAHPGQWTEAVVDLDAFAGRAVRLDLETVGDAPGTGWGEPAIYVAEPAREPYVTRTSDAKPAKNVIFVVLDTTRADAFAPFAPDNEIDTPAMDAFAERATTFVNAYDNANWTKPSVTTMLSSLYPTTHDARWAKSVVPDEVKLLSQHLDEHGFNTVAMVANAVVSKTFNFDRGWDLFENLSDGSEGNGYYLYRRAARWLDEHHDDGRFFLYVQSIDAHTTYDVPSKYSGRYFKGSYDGPIGASFDRTEQIKIDNYSMSVSDRDLDWIKALYYGEVTYQDEQLGVLLDKLDELELWDDTIVVVTNDHGEEIRDHGQMGHGLALFDELIRAPLSIHYPPLFPPGTEVEEVVEEVDLAPTLLEALHVPPMQNIEGLSLLDLFSDRPVRRRPFYAVAASTKHTRAIRVGRWKLIVDKDDGWMHLFDLDEDPTESANHVDDALIAGRMCEIYLAEALASPAKLDRERDTRSRRQLRATDADLDSEMRRKLETLGYL